MAVFGQNLILIGKTWTGLKSLSSIRNLTIQFDELEDKYQIFCLEESIVYLCELFKGTVFAGADQEENDLNKSDFEINYKEVTNSLPLIPRQQDKASLVAIVGREGSETIQATHDFSKKETWYLNSTRVDNEILSDSGNGLTYNSANPFWVDMAHGKVYDEDMICEDVNHGYSIEVWVTGSVLIPREPFVNSGGEFEINYRDGTITFFTAPTGPVTASYSHAEDSTWILKPYPSKSIDVEQAEVQFAKDIVINDTIVMEAWGWVQVFAPEYWEENGGPLPTNTLIRLEQTKYKTFYQIIDEALGSYPLVPGMSGSRGSAEIYGFPFRYGAVRRIHGNYGMEVRIYLENDIEFGGSRATATFYCISRNESDLK